MEVNMLTIAQITHLIGATERAAATTLSQRLPQVELLN